MDVLVLLVVGVVAGMLTTLAGMGGGIVLALSVALATDPKTALVATAPALLVGNAHRVWMFRDEVDRTVAKAFVLGALPGSIVGGFLLARVPPHLVTWLMLAMTALAVAKVFGKFEWKPAPRLLTPAGFGIGALAATAGGAGVLAGPVLIAAGLSGAVYVSTSAAGAVAMHMGRIVAYGASGLFNTRVLALAGGLTVCILLGNTLGKRARKYLTPERATRLELSTLVVASLLAVVGVGR